MRLSCESSFFCVLLDYTQTFEVVPLTCEKEKKNASARESKRVIHTSTHTLSKHVEWQISQQHRRRCSQSPRPNSPSQHDSVPDAFFCLPNRRPRREQTHGCLQRRVTQPQRLATGCVRRHRLLWPRRRDPAPRSRRQRQRHPPCCAMRGRNRYRGQPFTLQRCHARHPGHFRRARDTAGLAAEDGYRDARKPRRWQRRSALLCSRRACPRLPCRCNDRRQSALHVQQPIFVPHRHAPHG